MMKLATIIKGGNM